MNRTLLYLTLIGILIGAGGGYLYYHFVGCAGGTCAITSRPIPSTLYGAMMGGLLLNSAADFFKGRKRTTDPDKNNSDT